MPEDFVSVTDLEIFLGVTEGSLTPELASLAVNAAQATVRNYLQQEITYNSETIRLDGTGKSLLRLPQRPVREVASVTESGTSLTVVDDYLRDRSFLVRVDCFWVKGVRNVEVQYGHGWDVSDLSDSQSDYIPVPADIILATLSAARRFYQQQGTTSTGSVISEKMGDYSYRLSDEAQQAAGNDLITAEKAVLDWYKVGGAG